jgi:hypothetical protein
MAAPTLHVKSQSLLFNELLLIEDKDGFYSIGKLAAFWTPRALMEKRKETIGAVD